MRDLVLTAFILSLIPLALLRPWIGAIAYFWISLMSPHKMTWSYAATLPFALIIGVATLIGLVITRDKKSIPWSPELILVSILAFYFTLTTFFAWAPDYAWQRWDSVMKIFLMTFVLTKLIYGKERIRWLLLVTAISIGFFGFKGGIFSLLGGGVNQVRGPEGSFITSNTELGLAMLMVLPLLILMPREEKNVWLKRAFYICAILSCVAIIFTYSRGALLGAGIVLPLIFLKSKAKRTFLLIFIPLAYIGYQWAPQSIFKRAETIQTYEEDRSAMQRLQAWSVSWNIALDYPFTGAGFELEYSPDEERWLSYANRKYDTFGDVSRAPHSIYFQIIGQHGFVAAFLYLLMLLLLLLRLYRLRKIALRHNELQWVTTYADAIFLGMIGFLVDGAFLNVAYFDLMFLFLAMASVLQREVKEYHLKVRAQAAISLTQMPQRPPLSTRFT